MGHDATQREKRERARRKRQEKLLAEKDSLGLMKKLPAACLDETKAVEFLEAQRWGEDVACPHCGDMKVYQMQDRQGGRNKRFLWRCYGCNQQFTVRVGTVFEDSRIPLRHWCFAFWAACSGKKGVSALEIRRQTQVSYKSALFMMHRIRYAMTPDAYSPPPLKGVVEVDETYVGGKLRPLSGQEWKRRKRAGLSMRRNPGENKTPVLAMIQRDGDVRAEVVPDVTAKNVRDVLMHHVSPEAHLRTDESHLYTKFGRRFASHESVKHALYEFARGEVYTNTAESFFSRLKRTLYGTHHAVSKKHLHRYVAEVVFKHNTRKLDDGQRIVEAIKGADGKRLMYKEPMLAVG